MKLAIGAVYSVFSRNGCVVSFSDGTECLSVPAEEVRLLLAQEEEMEVSDPAAIVSIVPNGAEVLHGVMMSSYSSDKLPDGYTRVEFLEGTGTQYINVPRALTVAPDCSFVYIAQLTGGTSGSQHAFGARVAANSKEFGVSYNIDRSRVNVMLGGGGGVSIPCELTEPHELKANGATGKVVVSGGESYALNPVEITMSSIGVFRRSGIGYSYFTGRIFKVSIFNSGQQFMNMLPALDPTGTPCMFDRVSRTPFYNSGTGDFSYPGIETQAATYSLRRRDYAQMTEHGIRRLYHVPKGCNLTKEEYAEQNGFKILVETPAPEEGYWTPFWHEREDCIELEWVETVPPEDELSNEA